MSNPLKLFRTNTGLEITLVISSSTTPASLSSSLNAAKSWYHRSNFYLDNNLMLYLPRTKPFWKEPRRPPFICLWAFHYWRIHNLNLHECWKADLLKTDWRITSHLAQTNRYVSRMCPKTQNCLRNLILLHGVSQLVINILRFIVETFRSTRFNIHSIFQGLLNVQKRSPRTGFPGAAKCPVCSSPVFRRCVLLARVKQVLATIVCFQWLRGFQDSFPNMTDLSS